MSQPPPKIRVMVVDDHPVVRFGIAAMISAQPDMVVVAQAGTGKEAIQMFGRHNVDVTLMDLRLPEMSGVDAIRAIRSSHPDSAFIVLTTYQGDEDIHRALAAGAQAYLVKGMSYDELVGAIRKVHSGERYLPPAVIEALSKRPPNSELSPRELQILELIVKGRSNREIAEELQITVGTVKWHVNTILSRLHVSDRTQAAVTALHRGIVEF
jgi:DNA-binding NarL/FixJ family response regulator